MEMNEENIEISLMRRGTVCGIGKRKIGYFRK